ncbi:hypothetical protein K501DRAFT_337541 [Backusella circina FSU 941]|nr:hypothetical protein K501DRAFT_337541 [Backusella circina FSU 941]
MLIALPHEIVLDIAHNLEFKDKLNLMLTCRSFKDLIFNESLYEKLQVFCAKENTERIIKKFENKQFNGTQVKILEIRLNSFHHSLFTLLPKIFPNLTRFITHSEYKEPGDDVESMLVWKDTIEKYDVQNDFPQLVCLLERNVFSRLTELVLSPNFIEFMRKETNDIDMLNCLKHSPCLKKLVFVYCDINLDLLEKTHSSCPHLNTLILRYATIMTSNDALFTRAIVPATRLLNFELDYGVMIIDSHCVFLDYLSLKYPNLQKLKFQANFDKHQVEETINIQYFYNPNVIQSMVSDYESTRRAYFNRGSAFLANLPGTLKLLNIDATIFDHTIDHLRNITSLKHLKIKTPLPLPQDADHPVSLSVTELDIDMDGYYMSNSMVDLGQILFAFPRLHRLYIWNSNATIVGIESNETYPHLHSLSIKQSLADFYLLRFIQRAAPNLKRLTWSLFEKHNISNQAEYNIDLTGYTLDTFNLSISRKKYIFDGNHSVDLHIKTQNQTKRLVFTEHCSSISVLQPYHFVDPNKKLTRVNVLCDNIGQININNLVRIVKVGNQMMLIL